MKKTLLTILCAIMGSVSFAQTINTFPYTQDFEAFALCGTGAGTACALSEGWFNAAGDNIDWTTDVNGTGSGNTGPTANGGADHNPGIAGGVYLYTESSAVAGNPNAVAHLESPWFDFTTIGAPEVSFWYHLFGGDMGTLQVDVRTTLVGGATAWTTVDAPFTDDADIWQERVIALTAFAGLDSVQIRWHGITGIGFTSDMAIDDVAVYELPPVELGLTSIDSLPQSGCGLGTENVWITIDQSGSTGLVIGDTIFATYNDGTTSLNDTVVLAANLPTGGSLAYMFSSPVDYSVFGQYDIVATISNSLDSNALNDTSLFTLNSIQLYNTYPYYEDFESGNNGWIATSIANSSWELAVPASGVINTAASDSMAWITNATGLYNANENGYVQSPCFDFTTLDSADVFAMEINVASEFSWDGMNIRSSIDGGATWQLFGNLNDPTNWYNDNSINGNPGGSQIGWTGEFNNGWENVHHLLGNLGGEGSVMFRFYFGSDGSVHRDGIAFDNVQIGSPLPLDTMLADYAGCGPFTTGYTTPGSYSYTFEDTTTFATSLFASDTTGTIDIFFASNVDTAFNVITTHTDYLGCASFDTVLVSLFAAPYNVLQDTLICYNGMAAYSVTTGPNYEYLWSDMSTVDSAMFVGPTTVSVTVTDTVTGCFHTATADVTIATRVDLPSEIIICGGDTVTLDAGIFSTYSWSTGEVTQTIVVTTPGAYSVATVDTLIGCLSTDAVDLTQSLPMPSITGGMDTLCSNLSVTLDAGAGFSSYLWSTSGVAQTETVDGLLLPVGSNTISVEVADTNGCTNTDSYTFVVDGCAGVDELDATTMRIYPNPSNGIFQYEFENVTENVEMMISDLSGKIVFAEIVSDKSGIIDLTNYQTGVYILQVKTGTKISSIRLIKQ